MTERLKKLIDLVSDFKDRIEELTKYSLDSYFPSEKLDSSSGKFIHDNVWGTNYYEPWEVALIDSPLVQKLRNIHQTGLSFLVYPSATHTRFDHTLGVIAIVDRVVDSLNRKANTEMINRGSLYSIRLAAVLHDIGHGPFSHVLEDVYSGTDEFKAIRKSINEELGVTPKPHEIMSYLIVSSTYFDRWFTEKILNTGLMEDDIVTMIEPPKTIAGYIVGYSAEPGDKYLADIINGPMDADKLDYLARDAKFSGLSIGYDLDRYFKTINIHRIQKDGKLFRRLGVPLSGVNTLEQMIIGKMTLYSSFTIKK